MCFLSPSSCSIIFFSLFICVLTLTRAFLKMKKFVNRMNIDSFVVCFYSEHKKVFLSQTNDKKVREGFCRKEIFWLVPFVGFWVHLDSLKSSLINSVRVVMMNFQDNQAEKNWWASFPLSGIQRYPETSLFVLIFVLSFIDQWILSCQSKSLICATVFTSCDGEESLNSSPG